MPHPWHSVLATAAALAALAPWCATAQADGTGVACGATVGNCTIAAKSSAAEPVDHTGTSGSGAASSGSPGCSFHGRAFPCWTAGDGWFDQEVGCYYQLMDPQPDAGSAWWAGHQPGDGAVYSETCPLNAGKGLPGDSARWFQSPPPGYGGGVDVAALAQQAVKNMALVGPDIGIAPKVGGRGLVGLPVWLWDNVTPTTWGPNAASASAGGVTVTAKGSATQIAWTIGDGASVTCQGPGTAYQPSFGDRTPDCGHIYTVTSAAQPGGAYAIGATATWAVDWTATTGQKGTITVTRRSATRAVIGELQVLNNQ
jgi:hypothetical protein